MKHIKGRQRLIALAIMFLFMFAIGFAFTASAPGSVALSPTSSAAMPVHDRFVVERMAPLRAPHADYLTAASTDIEDLIEAATMRGMHGAEDEWLAIATKQTDETVYDLGGALGVATVSYTTREKPGAGAASRQGSTNDADNLLLPFIAAGGQSILSESGGDVFSFASAIIQDAQLQTQCLPSGAPSANATCGPDGAALLLAGSGSQLETPVPGALPLLLTGIAGLRFARRRTTTA